MEEKIKRFVQLSLEFTIRAKEIYPMDSLQSYTSGTIYLSTDNMTPSPSLLERFTKSQKEKIEKAERYEEYLELQKSLSDYYRALNKLT